MISTYYKVQPLGISNATLLKPAPGAPSVSPPPRPPGGSGFQGVGVLHP